MVAGARGRKCGHVDVVGPGRDERAVLGRDVGVPRVVVDQHRGGGRGAAPVAHCRRDREFPPARIAVAQRGSIHYQVRIARRHRHRHRHRRRAVVRGVRLPGHRVHAGAVVVRAGVGRSAQPGRLVTRARCGELAHRVRGDLRVRGRDDGVRRAVVAQRRCPGVPVAPVSHLRRQRERRIRVRLALADRRRVDHQIRERRRRRRHLHRGRAVVGRVRLVGDSVHARAVVVGARIRRRPQPDPFLAAGRSGNPALQDDPADLRRRWWRCRRPPSGRNATTRNRSFRRPGFSPSPKA